MTTTKLDLLLANIVLDYLKTAASQAAGVPTAGQCPLLIVDHDGDKPSNCLIVDGLDRGGNRMKQIAVVITHHCQLGTDDDSAQIPRAQSAAWLGSIEKRLRDESAFWAFLASIAASRRVGWELSHITFPAIVEIRREETGEAEEAVAVQFEVMV